MRMQPTRCVPESDDAYVGAVLSAFEQSQSITLLHAFFLMELGDISKEDLIAAFEQARLLVEVEGHA